ncbi:MAG: hypothetical protein ACPGVO_00195 [Spirulinaceae cyanobacterium]
MLDFYFSNLSHHYSIESVWLAGLPDRVIRRAHEVMAQIEKHSKIAVGLRRGTKEKKAAKPKMNGRAQDQLDIFGN